MLYAYLKRKSYPKRKIILITSLTFNPELLLLWNTKGIIYRRMFKLLQLK